MNKSKSTENVNCNSWKWVYCWNVLKSFQHWEFYEELLYLYLFTRLHLTSNEGKAYLFPRTVNIRRIFESTLVEYSFKKKKFRAQNRVYTYVFSYLLHVKENVKKTFTTLCKCVCVCISNGCCDVLFTPYIHQKP